MQTMPIVEEIKKQEEEKYNLKFEIETPTIIEYFKNNFKGKKLSLSESISTIVIGFNAVGIADCDNRKICIFKKSQGIYQYFKKSLKFRLNEAIISYTTFHEIRHILQNEREDLFQDYELFCINFLSIMNNKYLVNTEFHDSQYFEIDANIYGALETKKLFQKDSQVSKYFDEVLSGHLYEKYTYNFEYFFNKFLKTIQLGFDEDYYKNNSSINTYWNLDGSFKDLKTIIESSKLLNDNKLSTKIITSNAFLSTIDNDKLEASEFEFLKNQLKNSIEYFEEDIKYIYDLYNNRKIPKITYQMGIDFINKQIDRKQSFLNKINDLNKKTKAKILKRSIK